MDQTVFSVFKKEEEPDFFYWQSKSIAERLRAAAYFNSIEYNHELNNPPRIDKTVFSIEKLERPHDTNNLDNLKK